MDTSKDSVGAAPLLITLLEGVEMTEKQLAEMRREAARKRSQNYNFRTVNNSRVRLLTARCSRCGKKKHGDDDQNNRI
ncbi:hypothetical protein YC2023_035456 [Brassica napus]